MNDGLHTLAIETSVVTHNWGYPTEKENRYQLN